MFQKFYFGKIYFIIVDTPLYLLTVQCGSNFWLRHIFFFRGNAIFYFIFRHKLLSGENPMIYPTLLE